MSEKQNVLKGSSELIIFVLLLVIILFSFLVLAPRISSSLFPIKRQMVLQAFLDTVKKTNTVNPQKFWEFREFYSPGYITFNNNGLSNSQIKTAENKTGIFVNTQFINRIFLTFTSPHLSSFEALTTSNDFSKFINIKTLDVRQVIFSNNNTLIYRDGKQRIYVLFLKSQSDMESANGYFSDSDADKSLINGKDWLEVTALDTK